MVGKRRLLHASTDKCMWDVRMRVGYQVVVPNPPPGEAIEFHPEVEFKLSVELGVSSIIDNIYYATGIRNFIYGTVQRGRA